MTMPMQKQRLFYRGPSMLGTFRPGDRLRIEKLPLDRIRKGDAIVFSGQGRGEDDFVVHRVVGKDPAGITTRGDNNPKNDEQSMTGEDLIGKVTHYERNGKVHKAWNGRLGWMRARALHSRIRIARVVKFFLGKPYRFLKRSGIVAKIWRPEMEAIHFETRDGPLVKYVHKGKTVATCWTKRDQWRYRRPYDFVIGPDSSNRRKA